MIIRGAMTLVYGKLPVVLVVLLSLTLAQSAILQVSGDDPPPADNAQIEGDQIFPPTDLSNESMRQELAAWINQTLGLGISGSLIERASLYGGSFNDAYNETIPISARDWVSNPPLGTTLKLHYAASAREFIAFDIRFNPPRSIGAMSLRNFSIEVAGALGIELANASYVQYSSSYPRSDPNGTGVTASIMNTGSWRECRDSLPLHVINQLTIWEDEDSHAAVHMRSYRWLGNVPSVTHSIGEIINAAALASNQTYGPRDARNHGIGLMPNYQNLTWSYLVTLCYDESNGTEIIALLLDMESLEFQGVIYRIFKTPSLGDYIADFLFLAWFFIIALVVGALLVAISTAWFGHGDASWIPHTVALFLPLYIRLKRESILDHFLRGRIVEYVSSNPGATFSQIRDRFNAANGTLNYHLWILARTGFLRSAKEGKFVHYYIDGSARNWSIALSPFQYSLLHHIISEKSVSLPKLARELKCSKQRIHHNIRRLERLGLVELGKREGICIVSPLQAGSDFLADSTNKETA